MPVWLLLSTEIRLLLLGTESSSCLTSKFEMELDNYDVSLRHTGEDHDLVEAHHNLLLVNTDGSVHAAIKKTIVYNISVFYKIGGCSDHFALKYQVTKLT